MPREQSFVYFSDGSHAKFSRTRDGLWRLESMALGLSAESETQEGAKAAFLAERRAARHVALQLDEEWELARKVVMHIGIDKTEYVAETRFGTFRVERPGFELKTAAMDAELRKLFDASARPHLLAAARSINR